MPSNTTEDILRMLEDFRANGLKKIQTWKPPPSRAWVGRYNYAIRQGYSEKFATIFADQSTY